MKFFGASLPGRSDTVIPILLLYVGNLHVCQDKVLNLLNDCDFVNY